MSAHKLVRMANQIAIFFRTQPEEAAAAAVADHIKSFWSPVMRREIYAHLGAGGEGLEPLARAGLEVLKACDAGAYDGVTK
ncbi:MAG: formate dehydrogenase subunit delta [Beijerinckiaceae bacterium]|nr:formate dehydrogenase subunit delta [Beijerinckiaceae bacterium]